MKKVMVKFRDCEKELLVGDVVYVSNINDGKGTPREHIVSNVGNKYVSLVYSARQSDKADYKVSFDGFFAGNYGGHYSLWSSIEAFTKTVEKEEYSSALRSMISRTSLTKYDIDVLKNVAKLLNIEEEMNDELRKRKVQRW
jgi:hypothetical protein